MYKDLIGREQKRGKTLDSFFLFCATTIWPVSCCIVNLNAKLKHGCYKFCYSSMQMDNCKSTGAAKTYILSTSELGDNTIATSILASQWSNKPRFYDCQALYI